MDLQEVRAGPGPRLGDLVTQEAGCLCPGASMATTPLGCCKEESSNRTSTNSEACVNNQSIPLDSPDGKTQINRHNPLVISGIGPEARCIDGLVRDYTVTMFMISHRSSTSTSGKKGYPVSSYGVRTSLRASVVVLL